MNCYRPFSFELSVRIEFGIGTVRYLADHVRSLGGRHALIVTDPGLVAAGVIPKVTAVLETTDIAYTLFAEVQAEPDASGVEQGVELYRSEGCDIVISVGGGSSLDTGKAISVMINNEGHIRDYAGLGKLRHPGVPQIAIPTTAGTGSEATIWSVLSEKDKKIKYGVGSRFLVPTIALCDPELTVTLPPRLTAVTGIDALAHALESYVNKATQPISEALAEKSIQLVARSLRTAVFAGDQIAARADMLLASTIAATAFNATRLGLAHALAMPLGAKAKVPHADVITILLPEVNRYNLTANLPKFARIAELFGENANGLSLRQAAELGVNAVEQLIDDIGAPRKLGDYGVTEATLPEMAEEGMTSGNIAVNPRAATTEDLVEIMRGCL